MRKISKKTITLAISLILCFAVSAGITAAYFTDYESAKGGAVLNLSGQTRLEETMSGNNKNIVIRNTDETDMIVRVKVIGDEDRLTVTGTGWIKGDDGWYYWNKILRGGKSEAERDETSILRASITVAADEVTTDFIVVHEASRTVYDGSALAVPNGWDKDAVGQIALK